MNRTLNCRFVADALANNAAGYVVLAPPRHKETAIQSTLKGFQDACGNHGVVVGPDDVIYYLSAVEAKVAEITAALGQLGHA